MTQFLIRICLDYKIDGVGSLFYSRDKLSVWVMRKNTFQGYSSLEKLLKLHKCLPLQKSCSFLILNFVYVLYYIQFTKKKLYYINY